MHPTIHDELRKARLADIHRRAEQDRQARVLILARRRHREHGKDPVGRRSARVYARRLLAILGARLTVRSGGRRPLPGQHQPGDPVRLIQLVVAVTEHQQAPGRIKGT